MADEHLKYLTARITLDATDLDKAKAKVQETRRELDAAGKPSGDGGPEARFARIRTATDSVGEIGQKLTVGVTLPVLAIGAAAGKVAGDFNTTFTRMETLAGATSDEIAGLKDEVKTLASATGRGPQELAEALYFIRSAGLDGSVAIETLRASAQAAAVGLGETAAVADAVTSAINAYGQGNLKASDAVNVLIRTAREGKAEASELAPQFGRLLPVASALGISFDQVGAGLAFLTRNSGDASLASTQLSGIMNALLRPSAEARDLLAGVGLSAADLRAQLREQGLLATLGTLTDRFKGNQQALGTFFQDIQGLQGVLALTGSSAGDAAQVFEALKKNTDDLGQTFNRVAKDDAFKQKQALAEVQTALINLGQSTAPVITTIAGFISDLVGAFDRLPTPVKDAGVVIGLFVAALGPILSVGKNVVSTIELVKNAASGLAGAFTKQAAGLAEGAAATAAQGAALGPLGLAIGGVTAAVGIASIVYATWKQRKEELKQTTDNLRGSLQNEAKTVEEAQLAAIEATVKQKGLTDELARGNVTYDLVKRAVLGSAEAQEEYRRRLVDSGQIELRLTQLGVDRKRNLADLAQEFIRTGKSTDEFFVKGNGLVGMLADLAQGLRTVAQETVDQAVASGALTKVQAEQLAKSALLADGTADYATIIDVARKAIEAKTAATKDGTTATGAATSATEQEVLGAKDQEQAAKAAAKAIEAKAKALKSEYEETLAGLDAQIRYEQAVIAEREAIDKVNEAQDKVNKGGKDLEKNKAELEKATLAARQAFLAEALAAAEVDAKQQGLSKASDNAARSLEIQAEHLETVRDTLAPDSPLRAYLDQYIKKLRDEIPRQVATDVDAYVKVHFGEGSKFFEVNRKIGGPIPGPRDAPVPAMLHGGEFVLSADVVDAIAGGKPTLGLGARVGPPAATVGASGGGGAVTQVRNYTAKVYPATAAIDERALAEMFARMEVLL